MGICTDIPQGDGWDPLAGVEEEVTDVSLLGNCSIQCVTPQMTFSTTSELAQKNARSQVRTSLG